MTVKVDRSLSGDVRPGRSGLPLTQFYSQLWTVDHSVRSSMKNAANCAKHGELQGFMKPLLVERILRPWLTGQGHIHLRVEDNLAPVKE
jgi:hypothetical protein